MGRETTFDRHENDSRARPSDSPPDRTYECQAESWSETTLYFEFDSSAILIDHWQEVDGRMIPLNRRLWCTKNPKLKPCEEFVGDNTVLNYVGLRHDQERKGCIGHKPNIPSVHPFREAKLALRDIEQILRDFSIDMPSYTKRDPSQSGCFFCFYQHKIERVRPKETYPDLFDEAKKYDKVCENSGNLFAWNNGEPLSELEKQKRVIAIKAEYKLRQKREATHLTTCRSRRFSGWFTTTRRHWKTRSRHPSSPRSERERRG